MSELVCLNTNLMRGAEIVLQQRNQRRLLGVQTAQSVRALVLALRRVEQQTLALRGVAELEGGGREQTRRVLRRVVVGVVRIVGATAAHRVHWPRVVGGEVRRLRLHMRWCRLHGWAAAGTETMLLL
jgi:hypothetical protein